MQWGGHILLKMIDEDRGIRFLSLLVVHLSNLSLKTSQKLFRLSNSEVCGCIYIYIYRERER